MHTQFNQVDQVRLLPTTLRTHTRRLSGSWRTGSKIRVACHWWASPSATSPYLQWQAATLTYNTYNTYNIVCVVPPRPKTGLGTLFPSILETGRAPTM